MKMLFLLAWRNLWRKKRRTFITTSSVMFAAILAIALLSMVDGMKSQMVQTIVNNSTGYLQIQDIMYNDDPTIDHALYMNEEVEDVLTRFADRIDFVVPRLHGFCLASKDMSTRGVMVMGVDMEKETRMNNLGSRLVEGELFTQTDNFVLVAEGLARQLEVGVGDTIVLLGQGFQGMTAAGQFRIGGILSFFMPEQNNTMVYMPLMQAQWFFAAPERLTGLIIMTPGKDGVTELANDMQQYLDTQWYAVRTWHELMPDMLAAFEARDAQMKVFAWEVSLTAEVMEFLGSKGETKLFIGFSQRAVDWSLPFIQQTLGQVPVEATCGMTKQKLITLIDDQQPT